MIYFLFSWIVLVAQALVAQIKWFLWGIWQLRWSEGHRDEMTGRKTGWWLCLWSAQKTSKTWVSAPL